MSWKLFSIALRNITSKKIRTFLTIAGISLGVAVIFAVYITNESTLSQLSQMVNDISGQADLVVTSKGGAFDEKVVRKVLRQAGVEKAAPSASINSLVLDKSKEDIQILGVNYLVDKHVRNYFLDTGRLNFSNPNSAIISKSFADRNKLKVNKNFKILTPQGPKKLNIVAIIEDKGIARLNSGNVVIIDINDFQKIFSYKGKISQIDLLLKKQFKPTFAKRELAKKLGESYEVNFPETRGKNVQDLLASFKAALLIFSILSLIAGGFVAYNTLSMNVAEKTRENAMLRSIGFSKLQIFWLVIIEGLSISAMAIIIGFLFGLALAEIMTLIWANLLGTTVALSSIPASGLIISASLGFGLTFLASLKPAFDASKISPLQALKAGFVNTKQPNIFTGSSGILFMVFGFLLVFSQAKNNLGITLSNIGVLVVILSTGLLIYYFLPSIIIVLGLIISKLFPLIGKVSLDNVQRNRFQTALTLTTLIISVIMVIAIASISQSFKNSLKKWIQATISGDFTIRTKMPGVATDLENTVGINASLRKDLLRIKGIRQVTPVKFATTSAFGEHLTFVAIEPKTYRQIISFQFLEGEEEKAFNDLEKGKFVFISSVVSADHNLGVSDSIILTTPTGKRKFKIAGVITDFVGGGKAITGSYKDLKQSFKIETVDIFAVSLVSQKYFTSVKRILNKEYGQKKHLIIQSNKDFKTFALKKINNLFVLFNVVSFIAITIATFGLANTLVMSILKRIRELAILRAIGFLRSQIRLMVMLESQIITFISLSVGLVLGTIISKRLVFLFSEVTGFKLTYDLPIVYLIEGLLIVPIITLIASTYPASRAIKSSIIRGLRS